MHADLKVKGMETPREQDLARHFTPHLSAWQRAATEGFWTSQLTSLNFHFHINEMGTAFSYSRVLAHKKGSIILVESMNE